jgi:hypothetical protein
MLSVLAVALTGSTYFLPGEQSSSSSSATQQKQTSGASPDSAYNGNVAVCPINVDSLAERNQELLGVIAMLSSKEDAENETSYEQRKKFSSADVLRIRIHRIRTLVGASQQ